MGRAAERITELDWWQSTERNGIRYTALPARHDSSRTLTDHNQALWSSFVIEHGGGKILFSRRLGTRQPFRQNRRKFNGFDIAFIENGQYSEHWPNNHLFPEQTARYAAQLAL